MTWKELEKCRKEKTLVKSPDNRIGYVNAVGRLFSYVFYPIQNDPKTLGELILVDNRSIEKEES